LTTNSNPAGCRIDRSAAWGGQASRAVLYRSGAAGSREQKPGPLEVHPKDDHMHYAITRFALAGAVVIAFGA
jgi:cytochrome oxidase assembly protein ShyY1